MSNSIGSPQKSINEDGSGMDFYLRASKEVDLTESKERKNNQNSA
jgi:hypothetical protein